MALAAAGKAVKGMVKNTVTSIGGAIFGASTGAKALGVSYPITLHHGHPPVDIVLLGMALGGTLTGVAAKDWNQHSTATEVQAATVAANQGPQPPAPAPPAGGTQ